MARSVAGGSCLAGWAHCPTPSRPPHAPAAWKSFSALRSREFASRGRAVGVRLEGGRTIDAKAVVSTADPKRTFLQMVEPDHLPVEFRRAIAAIKMHGAAMKVNCALSELPRWSAADQTPGPQHRGRPFIGTYAASGAYG